MNNLNNLLLDPLDHPNKLLFIHLFFRRFTHIQHLLLDLTLNLPVTVIEALLQFPDLRLFVQKFSLDLF